MGLQALGQQVGGQQGHLAGLAQARSAHHADVHPADRQNRSTPQGCRRHGPHPTALNPCGTRQEGQQMGCHCNRSHAGAAAAVGNAEGLVQVEVADIGAVETRLAQAHLGVEVGAIEIHLAAAGVHQLADAANSRLKHTVGGGIGDHQRRQLLGVGSGLGL